MSGFDSAQSWWLDPASEIRACPDCGGAVAISVDGASWVCTFWDCNWTDES